MAIWLGIVWRQELSTHPFLHRPCSFTTPVSLAKKNKIGKATLIEIASGQGMIRICLRNASALQPILLQESTTAEAMNSLIGQVADSGNTVNTLVNEVRDTLVELVGESVKLLPGIVLAFVVLFLTRTVANLVRQAFKKIAFRTLKSLSLQSLFVQAGYVSAWTIGILLACTLAFKDLGFKDIISLLGLGSVAIGFAFQDIFKNFLSGILLLIQEPFSIGDQIIVTDYEGTVEEIALRATKIRTYQGELVVMPNSIVFTSPVQVMTGKPQRRTDLAIGVDYNTHLPHAVKVLSQTTQSVEAIHPNPKLEVDVVGFGDSSIDLVVRYWTNPDQASVRRIKTNVMLALKKACDDADINIPYPIRTVYHFDQDKYNDNKPSDSYSDSPESKKLGNSWASANNGKMA